jgi:beta-mannosidase
MNIHVKNPLLWWPKHYGKPNLYHVSMTLVDDFTGEEMDRREFDFGIRTVRLDMKEIATKMPEPDFQFVVNGVPVRAFGLNHVPCDALHSRDSERAHDILQLAAGADINILRIWGGSVPESDDFYCFCDREGIMIWHDFMMACGAYPRDEEFMREFAAEAVAAVRRLRHHPAIVVWAGDNECDGSYALMLGDDPANNTLTRKLLPDICSIRP